MADELKGLIEKIQQEGVQAAEEKAAAIVAAAQKEAGAVIARARAEAERLLSDARAEIAKAEEGGRSSLRQASRDTVLSLRKEIAAILDRIVAVHTHKALTNDEIAQMIAGLVRGFVAGHTGKTVVTLKKEEVEKVEKALLAELGAEVKKGILLKHAADVRGGFLISFDGGKSCYDFTDKALADYIASYLKPRLGEILKEAAPADAKRGA